MYLDLLYHDLGPGAMESDQEALNLEIELRALILHKSKLMSKLTIIDRRRAGILAEKAATDKEISLIRYKQNKREDDK